MGKLIIAGVLALLTVSCTKTLWLYEDDPSGKISKYKGVKGIPFYIKTERHTQVTKHIKTWTRLTLTVKATVVVDPANAKKNIVTVQSYSRDILNSERPKLSTLKTTILTAENNRTGLVEVKKAFDDAQIASFESEDDIPNRLVANTILSEWVVDKTKKYYINAPVPWFGTNEFTQTLNADGTLATSTTKSDSKLAEAITSIIPFKEFLTGKFVSNLADIPAEAQTEMSHFINPFPSNNQIQNSNVTFVYELSIEEVGYEYELKKVLPDSYVLTNDIAPLLMANINKLQFTKKEIKPEPPKKPEEKKEDEGKKIVLDGGLKITQEEKKEEETP